MPSMSAVSKIFAGLALAAMVCSCAAQKDQIPVQNDVLGRIITTADKYLEQGRYREVEKILGAYLTKYPRSEYSDDAAYRLAYLRVVAESGNPYFDYKAARERFLKFKQDFPASRYLYACNNWLKVLNLMRDSKLDAEAGEIPQTDECDRLREEVRKLQKENMRLQAELKDLESALDR